MSCALFISAPASGQGKTTFTAALARLLVRTGKRVQVFKTGPDYLDPQILEQASRRPVAQLDLWMAGEAWCRHQLHRAAQEADVILVEGAMGLLDGTPSSADLAATFGFPVLLLMDVAGMAQTAGAVASGLARYRDDYQIVGLVANNCASPRHRDLVAATLSPQLPLVAAISRNEAIRLPERHLGLVQAQEAAAELERCFEQGADLLQETDLLRWLDSLPPVTFALADEVQVQPLLVGKTIAVAKDLAFSFIYEANVQLLQAMGARLRYFSPLDDTSLPPCDALWLPGGYPELHAERLAANRSMLAAIRACHAAGKPILAECGGFLYCLQSLANLQGAAFPMAGLMPGRGVMRERGGCQGMQAAPLPEGVVRGHAHHRSASLETPQPIAFGQRPNHPAPGEAIYRTGSLTATYLHLYFASNPPAIADLFRGRHVR
ncbi:cobyrinate a,c-diamide synthase [Ketobacter sp.]|uniref:cobyrinate a,c-diamide synthase n=1 Tax=Ketobacter sp. TaxID=2083498 RepID=UPI000F1EB453|nr:cobyrinate a,c-diamide synthase [Ketobacter sp.]RLT94004.1 MAG: cobyrinate a,c-diamide synthase [Ketobacter sp.]